MFAGKKSAQIREILISESAWEEMTCLFAPSLNKVDMNTVDKRHVIEDLDFDWLLTSSLRIKPIYDNFVRQVSNVIEYNDYLGRKNKYHSSCLMAFVT